jgi:hypothetical protein
VYSVLDGQGDVRRGARAERAAEGAHAGVGVKGTTSPRAHAIHDLDQDGAVLIVVVVKGRLRSRVRTILVEKGSESLTRGEEWRRRADEGDGMSSHRLGALGIGNIGQGISRRAGRVEVTEESIKPLQRRAWERVRGHGSSDEGGELGGVSRDFIGGACGVEVAGHRELVEAELEHARVEGVE